MKNIVTYFAITTVALGLVVSAVPQTTHALSCIAPPSDTEFIASGGVIFAGTVSSNTSVGTVFENDNAQDKRKVVFNVTSAWSPEGRINTPFTIYDYVPPTDPFSGGDDIWGFRKTFSVAQRYIVYATFENGEYRADIGGCDRSHEYQQQSFDRISAELGASYTPAQGPNPVSPKPEPENKTLQEIIKAQIAELLQIIASLQQRLFTIEQAPETKVVVDFQSCVAAGNAVMESYPRQCRHGGTTYVENVSNNPGTPIVGSTCPNLVRNLGPGASGGDVAQLQEHLGNTGDFRFPTATGFYGSLTVSAVQAFQCRALGLCSGSVTTNGYGAVGPQTRVALTQTCGNNEQPTVCTLQYDPVCGRKGEDIRTYGNSCMLKASNAQFLYEGQCRPDTTSTAPHSCKVWNDGCNTCTRTEPGGPLACTKRACIWQGIPMCEMYFDDEPRSGAPVIHGFEGPVVLTPGAVGTWSIKASDPNNDSLSYKVDWGDARFIRPLQSLSDFAGFGFVQNTTFTHSYANPGIYTISVTVRDAQGLEARTTTTVKVDQSSTRTDFSVSPVSGVAPVTTTATVTLPPRTPGLFEVCGPIVVGKISWGDGTTESMSRLGCSDQRVVIAQHTYTNPGTYTVIFSQVDGLQHSRTVRVN